MRRAARTDANQTSIVDALRRCGCLVMPLHQMGQGVPDLLICHRGVLAFVEVKDGDKSPSKRRLTVDQKTWHRQWKINLIEAGNPDGADLAPAWNLAPPLQR